MPEKGGKILMAKRKEQFRKQQIATVGHSDKSSRRMNALATKIATLRAKKTARQEQEAWNGQGNSDTGTD